MEWHDNPRGFSTLRRLDGSFVGEAWTGGYWHVLGFGSGWASRPTLEAAKAETEAAVWARMSGRLE